MRIAIIGAGMAGLACARECERLGVLPDVFERDSFPGWIWPSVGLWLNVLQKQMGGDIRDYLKEYYSIDLKPIAECKCIIMKSPGKEIKIKGKLGYFFARGKIAEDSVEKQLLRDLRQTALHFNRPSDYKELSQKYDYIVVANGKDTAAKEMDIWEEYGQVYIRGAVAMGSFETDTTKIYWNTGYAGHGYARVTPFSPTHAIVGLYNIGAGMFEMDRLFTKFIEEEGLAHLEYIYKLDVPAFSTGRVKKFRVGNVLLAGRAAGLTERLMGAGGAASIISGVLAARAMIKDMDYDSLLKPMQYHIENISALRKPLEGLDNNDFDSLLGLLGTPGVKQAVYNSPVDFMNILGGVLRMAQGIKAGRGGSR